MEKRWVIADKVRGSLKEQLLSNRGLSSSSEIRKFIHAHLNQLEPANNLFPELKKAVERLRTAITGGELIYVYGDYDVDGITGCALLWETLDFLKGKVLPYIPSRSSEGYGLHNDALEHLAHEGARVVISVDCGITAVKEAETAKKFGIDLIITDHHQPQDKLPKPFALIHSLKMAGSGVAFRLAETLLSSFEKENDVQHFKNLELAALGTISDMVPLIGDNRIIVKNGLPLLSKTSRFGLKALYAEAEIGKIVGTYEVGFIISPRLNAMGRLDSALNSLRLLLTRKSSRAEELAQLLSRTNKERQQKTIEAFDHAKRTIEEKYSQEKFLVVNSKDYPEGIVGLVASRLVELFYKPTAVIGKGEKIFKGSARSIAGFNITEAIHSQAKLLFSHGGHPMAAGFSIEEKNISTFRKNLNKFATKNITPEQLQPIIKIDAELELDDLNTELADLLKEFEPFGIGNPEPVFLTKKLKVVESRVVGKENNHIKLSFRDEKGKPLDAIGFNLITKQPDEGDIIDIVYNVRENYWNSRKRLEARLKDLQKSN